MAATIARARATSAGSVERVGRGLDLGVGEIGGKEDPDVPIAVARPDEDPLEGRVPVEEVHPMAGLAADDRAARRQVVDLAVDQCPGLVRIEHDLGGEAVGLEHHEADRLAAAAVPGRRPEAGLLDAGIGQLAERRRRAVAAGLAQIGRLAFELGRDARLELWEGTRHPLLVRAGAWLARIERRGGRRSGAGHRQEHGGEEKRAETDRDHGRTLPRARIRRRDTRLTEPLSRA